ncbi:MAG TPA: hypothetical protein VN813_04265 [Luteibacter sp.]|nr:hypothetical protein [Luteibacter sp.]
MKKHSDSTTSLADVRQLTYFRIYKTHPGEQHGTIKLFSNGNQQCPINVGLVAADADANPIPLTQAELESALKLVHYAGGGDDVPLGSDDDGYTCSFVKNRFTWTESAIPGQAERSTTEPDEDADEPPPADIQILTVYVSASPDSPALAVAARFEVTDALFFTTNSSADDSNGQGEDGQFNSSVEVVLAAPPVLSVADFGAGANGVVSGIKVGSQDYFYWATEYYLNPTLNSRALPLLSVGASEATTDAFGFYTHGGSFDHVTWAISYYSQPGSETAETDGLPKEPLHAVKVEFGHPDGKRGDPLDPYLPSQMYADCVGRIEGANANRVVIGILKANLQGTFQDSAGKLVSDVGSTTMHILDAYGNNHRLSLTYHPGTDAFSIA